MAEIIGARELRLKLEEISGADYTIPLMQSCALVEGAAKENIVANGSVGEGALLNSIQYNIEGTVGIVGSNLFYAPYVEFGTGDYAVNGDGRTPYWVYVKNGDDGYSPAEPGGKTYTLEEAKQVMAILRSKGLEAYYTAGSRPKPFLNPALENNELQIRQIFDDYIQSILEGDTK